MPLAVCRGVHHARRMKARAGGPHYTGVRDEGEQTTHSTTLTG
jgi:hypothetical protein